MTIIDDTIKCLRVLVSWQDDRHDYAKVALAQLLTAKRRAKYLRVHAGSAHKQGPAVEAYQNARWVLGWK